MGYSDDDGIIRQRLLLFTMFDGMNDEKGVPYKNVIRRQLPDAVKEKITPVKLKQ